MKIEVEERKSYITIAAFWESGNPATNGRRIPLLTTCGKGIQISPLTVGDGSVTSLVEALAGARDTLSTFRDQMIAEDATRERMFAVCREVAAILQNEESTVA